MALRIGRELPGASDAQVAALYSDLVSFWAAGLLPHFRVEQECLLARLLRHVGREDEAVRRTMDDHLEMESLVTAMRDSSDMPARREALAAFGTTLRDHIRWEEATLFELVQQELEEAEMDALGADIDEAIGAVVPAPEPRARS